MEEVWLLWPCSDLGVIMSGNKIGKWFEKQVRNSLASLREEHGIFFHKLHDSYTAGRVIGSVPADFLVRSKIGAQLWECKASEVHYSLRSCLANMVDDEQVSQHWQWENNGGRSIFLFYSDLTAEIEVWSGGAVVAARLASRPVDFKQSYTYPFDRIDDCLKTVLDVG